MLKLFEKSTGIQVVVILTVTALLWVPSLAHPLPMVPPDGFGPLYKLLYNLAISPTLSVIVAMMLVLAGGLLLNMMLASANLVSQNSLLPTLLFVVFTSASTPTLSPLLIVSVLSIAVVRMLLLHGTLLTVQPDKVFAATALISICTLFYLPSLALLAAYLLVAVSYRLYSWHEASMLILGLLAPYLPLWMVLAFNGGLGDSLRSMGETFITFNLNNPAPHTPLETVANGFLLVIFFISLFSLWARLGENTVVWQKNATTVMTPTAAAIVVAFYSGLFPANLQFFAIPFALCGSIMLTSRRRRRSSANQRKVLADYLNDIMFILIIIASVLC